MYSSIASLLASFRVIITELNSGFNYLRFSYASHDACILQVPTKPLQTVKLPRVSFVKARQRCVVTVATRQLSGGNWPAVVYCNNAFNTLVVRRLLLAATVH